MGMTGVVGVGMTGVVGLGMMGVGVMAVMEIGVVVEAAGVGVEIGAEYGGSRRRSRSLDNRSCVEAFTIAQRRSAT